MLPSFGASLVLNLSMVGTWVGTATGFTLSKLVKTSLVFLEKPSE